MSQESEPPVLPVEPPIEPAPQRPPLPVWKILLRVFIGLVVVALLLFGVCLAILR